MRHQSFDMHFFRDRTGKWCVSYTTPSGERTWRRRLDEVDIAMVRQLAGYMVNMGVCEADLPLIRFDDEETS